MINGLDLRKWTIEDAADLTAIINNKKVQDMLTDGLPYPYTENDARDFIRATLAFKKNAQYTFAITYDGKVIGNISVIRKENVYRLSAEIGYYIAEGYWGRGLMTQAVMKTCDYIFENTDIVRIFARPYAHNTASIRVLEKAGFQPEGVLRRAAVKNGRIVDIKMCAMLKPASIRLLNAMDIVPAMELVWRVFSEFAAPEYTAQGIADFKAFIEPSSITKKMQSGEFKLWGAFDLEKPVGVIAIQPPLHISLLFVDKEHHGRKIGRRLFETLLRDEAATLGHDCVTVKSSPYAVKIYPRLGFKPTGPEQMENGARFTPMEYKLTHGK